MSVSSRLRKILIANRGEIACRVIRSAKSLGVKTVGVYSDADSQSMHINLSDEAYNIGRPPAQESYLRGERLIEVAKLSGATAIHPGYGFLSENAEFASLCKDSGIIFIGPPASAIRDMGIKSTSKQIMSDAGVPVIPGYHGEDQSEKRLLQEADRIGFPLMIKAVRGGGGKGMRIVRNESEFLASLESAKREAMKSFGDSCVLLERYVARPRHVEVQVFGDSHGNYVYLYERDCSVQRRHQKVIEQAPAPGINSKLRAELGEAAVKAASAVGYVGAGTVEFILDTADNKFYFMEMNTRLQVEHPVTEMVTGLDLVEWQLRVAAGEALPLKQDQIPLKGTSLEARLYAEDVPAGFIPTAGRLAALSLPSGRDTRVETGVREGDDVSVHYDPMIAKLVVWHEDTDAAFYKLEDALSQFNIVGVENNVDFLRKLCKSKDLIEGNVHTGFIDEHREELIPSTVSANIVFHGALAVILGDEMKLGKLTQNSAQPFSPSLGSSFRVNMNHSRTIKLKHLGNELVVSVRFEDDGWMKLSHLNDSLRCKASLSSTDNGFCHLTVTSDSTLSRSKISYADDKVYIFNKVEDVHFEVVSDYQLGSSSTQHKEGVSPMPGVIEKVFVRPGDKVKSGDFLAVVMAMKMEHVIKADKEGVIASVLYKPGDNIAKNASIVSFEK